MSADVLTLDDLCVIAFRGTDDVQDWLANLSMDRVGWYGGRVHHGFRKAETRLFPKLLRLIPGDVQRFWITGHSLGGALATLCAFRMQRGGYGIRGLYTFGSPRVGCRCLAAQHDWLLFDRHYRFVHNNDAVPRVPLPFRFRHCGRQVLLTRKHAIVVEPGCFYQWYDRVLGYRGDWIRDHLMGGYLTALAPDDEPPADEPPSSTRPPRPRIAALCAGLPKQQPSL